MLAPSVDGASPTPSQAEDAWVTASEPGRWGDDEIEIVSENDVLIITRPLQNYCVCCPGVTNGAPMDGFKAAVGKELCP